MECFDYKLQIKSLSEQGKFEGYAAVTGNRDIGGDVILPGAFKKTLQEQKIFPLLWSHDLRELLGIVRVIKEDEKGLLIEGEFNLEVASAREKYSLMKQGALKGLSIGYKTVQDLVEEATRYLKELALYEISLVTLPMNPLAAVTNIKAVVSFQDLPLADVATPWDVDKAEKRVRKWSGADEEGPNEKYRRAFLWYDAENSENFTAYKLLIGDTIAGELKAVPRAIFAVAGVLQGARGGVNIPKEDVPKVRAHLARYYKKLDRTPPWEEGAKALEEAIIAFGANMIDSGIELRQIKALLDSLEPAGTTQDSLEVAELVREVKSFREDLRKWKPRN